MKNIFTVFAAFLAFLALTCSSHGQAPSTTINPLFSTNTKWVQGFAPSYSFDQSSTGLTFGLLGGVNFACGSLVNYPGGSLALTANSTNFIYLDTTASCAPTLNTTGFVLSTQVPLFVVQTSSTGTVAIQDVRTMQIQNPTGFCPISGCTFTGPISGTTATFSGASINGELAVNVASTLQAEFNDSAVATGSFTSIFGGLSLATNNGWDLIFQNVGGSGSSSNTMQLGLVNGNQLTIGSTGSLNIPGPLTGNDGANISGVTNVGELIANSIQNSPIGSTTPSTGAFTSLSATMPITVASAQVPVTSTTTTPTVNGLACWKAAPTSTTSGILGVCSAGTFPTCSVCN
jgi:hypothetical protein